MKLRLLLITLLASVLSLSAQDMREVIKNDPNYSASNLLSYIYKPTASTDVPKGYKPFYISHYGRHGSRWHTNSKYYERGLYHFAKAEKQDALTDLGKEVYERIKRISADAAGREGQLTPKGVEEHRGIAERMVRNYPEIFSTKGGRECRIECFSTLYPRCILSMAANNERIKELNPEVEFTRITGARYLSFMSNTPSVTMTRSYFEKEHESHFRHHFLHPDRLVASLFKPEYAEKIDKYDAMLRVFRLAGILQNVDYLGESLYDIFTSEELYELWLFSNFRHYIIFGSSVEYGDLVAKDASNLMRHIIADVDDVIANGGRSGCLRFGHDMIVVPLIAMLDMEGRCPRLKMEQHDEIHKHWQDVNITSMAANVQLVFYRNREGKVLVKALHNEAEVKLPFESEMAPYYRWEDFRSYYLERMKRLEKLTLPPELAKYKKAKSVL